MTKNNSASPHSLPQVPIIDLSLPSYITIPQIRDACTTLGFFHVIHHDLVSPSVIQRFRTQTEEFFHLPHSSKTKYKRNAHNARGYFDDELTKRRRDWKECVDFGMPGSRDWETEDSHQINECLDGLNRFPSEEELPAFREAVVDYFDACALLSDVIARLMLLGLEDGGGANDVEDAGSFVEVLKRDHTSYLRINHYTPCPTLTLLEDGITPPLGVSPHTDAGFLTVLMQDDDCHSLQVATNNEDEDGEGGISWIPASPVKGAFTINTGDMAMIWSNGRYRAPLHRVLTHPTKHRYSAPFFYNPGYNCLVRPVNNKNQIAKYRPCLWGYFRAVRFAGDLTDFGTEIQIQDYNICDKEDHHAEENKTTDHVERQALFLEQADFKACFSVDKYRPLLESKINTVE